MKISMGGLLAISIIVLLVGCGNIDKRNNLSDFRIGNTTQRIALYNALKTQKKTALPTINRGMRNSDPYICGYSLLLAAELKDTSLIPIMIKLFEKEEYLKKTTIELFPDLMHDYSGKVFLKYPRTPSGGREATLWAILSHAIYETTNHKATINNIRTWWGNRN